MSTIGHKESDNDIGSISEPFYVSALAKIGPPLVFLTHYAATFSLILILAVYDDRPLPMILFAVLVTGLGVALLPVWYKTFFDCTYPGIDRVISVEWTPACISFRGGYFHLEVPPSDVLAFRTWGVRRINQAHILKVLVKGPSGAKRHVYLCQTMTDKDKFLDFLMRCQMEKGRKKPE